MFNINLADRENNTDYGFLVFGDYYLSNALSFSVGLVYTDRDINDQTQLTLASDYFFTPKFFGQLNHTRLENSSRTNSTRLALGVRF